MIRYDHVVELPVDPQEAVRLLRRELKAAEQRLAEARHAALLATYREAPRTAPQRVAD